MESVIKQQNQQRLENIIEEIRNLERELEKVPKNKIAAVEKAKSENDVDEDLIGVYYKVFNLTTK